MSTEAKQSILHRLPEELRGKVREYKPQYETAGMYVLMYNIDTMDRLSYIITQTGDGRDIMVRVFHERRFADEHDDDYETKGTIVLRNKPDVLFNFIKLQMVNYKNLTFANTYFIKPSEYDMSKGIYVGEGSVDMEDYLMATIKSRNSDELRWDKLKLLCDLFGSVAL